ncbi:hypothetical protein ACROYT_G044228 [Oculina patagonica]
MALKEVICVFFVCFFALGSATYCTWDSDCDTISGESCCSDSICREACIYCSSDNQCGTDEVCCDGDCETYCSSYTVWTGGVVAGTVIGTIVFFAIIISIVSCCCCACCPYYRYRSPGTVIVTGQPGYQPFVSTTSTTQHMQYPPPGNYNQPPPGYTQGPPGYPGYPQPSAQYPPPQGQGMHQPPATVGMPAK